MAMIGKVKRMHFREKKSVREIVRLTSLSRNTVRKWLKAPVAGEPKYRRDPRPGKLTAFHEALQQQALKVDAHRPKRDRRTAQALYAEIKAAGYAGGYTRVTDFIRAWRQGAGQTASTTAFRRFFGEDQRDRADADGEPRGHLINECGVERRPGRRFFPARCRSAVFDLIQKAHHCAQCDHVRDAWRIRGQRRVLRTVPSDRRSPRHI